MNERAITWCFDVVDPDETAASGALATYWVVPYNCTIVHVSAAPLEDDAGATVDINDDGTAVISGVDASDKDVPGTWDATPAGSQTPVKVAAGSEMTLDINNGAAANRFTVVITALVGELHA